jgi:hypothetical protein
MTARDRPPLTDPTPPSFLLALSQLRTPGLLFPPFFHFWHHKMQIKGGKTPAIVCNLVDLHKCNVEKREILLPDVNGGLIRSTYQVMQERVP